MTEQRPPERRTPQEEREFHERLHRISGNGGEAGVRCADPRRHTDSPPIRRYRPMISVVAVAFVVVVIYITIDALVGD